MTEPKHMFQKAPASGARIVIGINHKNIEALFEEELPLAIKDGYMGYKGQRFTDNKGEERIITNYSMHFLRVGE